MEPEEGGRPVKLGGGFVACYIQKKPRPRLPSTLGEGQQKRCLQKMNGLVDQAKPEADRIYQERHRERRTENKKEGDRVKQKEKQYELLEEGCEQIIPQLTTPQAPTHWPQSIPVLKRCTRIPHKSWPASVTTSQEVQY